MKSPVVASAVVAVALSVLVAGCPRPTPPEAVSGAPAPPLAGQKTLTVFAGAASKPALTELARRYQDQKDIKVDVTFGGSGSVLNQFSQEQYGDVYIPGSDDFMDKAEKKDAVLQDTRAVLVYLVPTICVAKGNPQQVKGLADFARPDLRVVLGNTQSVCLGAIGQEVLEKKGLWAEVQPKIASYATSCEDVLNTLLLGEADVVIGWDVFGRQQPDKVACLALPAGLTKARNIPAAVIKWSREPEAARAFIAYLTTPESQALWTEKGYTTEAPAAGAKP